MTAWFLLFAVVACFSGFGLCMKFGGRVHNSPFAISFSIFVAGGVLTAVYMLATGSHLFTGPIVFWGAVCGVVSAVAVVSMVKAMQVGHYGLSVSILSMSSIVPVAAAFLFWNKSLRAGQFAAMAVIFASLFLITCFGRTSGAYGQKQSWGRWLAVLLVAFFMNGLALVSHAAVANLAESNFFSFLFVAYVISAAVLTGSVIKRRSLNRKVVLYGILGAGASLTGCVGQLT